MSEEYIYDAVPYLSRAYPATHIRNLAAIARLRGMEPARPDACRVLELGCATGINLFSMASQYPDSHFTGIDNSSRQIEHAVNIKRQTSLENIDLFCLDIMEIGRQTGQFDYIIAHGVYSWVPAEVRKKILAICKECLSADGVAYISYNVLPGWHLFGTLRDMMRYHVSRLPEDTESGDKIRSATEYLKNLTGILPAENNPYVFQLRKASEKVIGNETHYLLHEYLADINEPFHFHEFIAECQASGLQYVGDATTLGLGITPYHTSVVDSLNRLSRDLLDFEQHVDFLFNRKFRSALLCQEQTRLAPAFSQEKLDDLYLSSMSRPVTLPTDKFGNTVGYQCEDNTYVDPHPLFQQTMRYLTEIYPDAVTLCELKQHLKIPESGAGQTPDIGSDLAARILRARSAGVLNITLDKPHVASSIGGAPKAEHFARALSITRTTREIPTPWHENAGLDDFILRLLPQLDGTRDESALITAMDKALGNDTALFGVPTPPPPGGPERIRWIEQNLRRGLEFLRRAGLLVPA